MVTSRGERLIYNRNQGTQFYVVVRAGHASNDNGWELHPKAIKGSKLIVTRAKTEGVLAATLASVVVFWACFGECWEDSLIGLGEITGDDREVSE